MNAAINRIVLANCLIALLVGASNFSRSVNAAEPDGQQPVEWKAIGHYAQLAQDQTWVPSAPSRTGKFKFSAIRFHLGYFDLRLLAVAQFQKVLAKTQNVVANLADLGLSAIAKSGHLSSNILVLAPAGFPASERTPDNLGLLKVDGKVWANFLNEGPSAVLCLDSPYYAGTGYQYQLPTFFRTSAGSQRHLINDCKNAVQVGPRLLEDPESTVKREGISYLRTKADGSTEDVKIYPGIPDSSANRSAYNRTVFAIDEPDRNFDDRKAKENARNAYLIVTQTPATLWDLQDMLMSPKFYANRRLAPWWSVNLVGGDYAGMIVWDKGKQIPIGNVDITQASMLAVVQRK